MKHALLETFASTALLLGAYAPGSYGIKPLYRQPEAKHALLRPVTHVQPEKNKEQNTSSDSEENIFSSADMVMSPKEINRLSLQSTEKEKAFEANKTPQELSAKQGSAFTSLLIINTDVENYQSLYSNIAPGTDIALVDANKDGLSQLKTILSAYHGLECLYVFSHVQDGVLHLGNSQVTEERLRKEFDVLASIDDALIDGADVYLYGCELAKSEKGERFLSLLASEANVDVAASNNLTGSENQGGDWNLEIKKGRIDSDLGFSAVALKHYDGLLAINDATGRTIDTSGFPFGYAVTKSYDVDGSGFIFRVTTNSADSYALYTDFGYLFANLSRSIPGLTEVAVDFAGGNTFDIYSVDMQSFFTRNYVFTPSTGSPVVLSVTDATVATQTLNFTNITSFTVERQDGGDLLATVFVNFVIKNASSSFDSDGNLTASATVTEPVAIDTTVDTVGEAVDVFDFTLSDGGGGDGCQRN